MCICPICGGYGSLYGEPESYKYKNTCCFCKGYGRISITKYMQYVRDHKIKEGSD